MCHIPSSNAVADAEEELLVVSPNDDENTGASVGWIGIIETVVDVTTAVDVGGGGGTADPGVMITLVEITTMVVGITIVAPSRVVVVTVVMNVGCGSTGTGSVTVVGGVVVVVVAVFVTAGGGGPWVVVVVMTVVGCVTMVCVVTGGGGAMVFSRVVVTVVVG